MDGDCDLMELVFCPSPPLLQFAAVGAGIESKVPAHGGRRPSPSPAIFLNRRERRGGGQHLPSGVPSPYLANFSFEIWLDRICVVSRMQPPDDRSILQVEVAGDSDLVELFQCPRTSSSRYRLALMKLSLKPLSQSQKVSLRTDARGFLCLQYMIKTGDGHICFVEFFVSRNIAWLISRYDH